MLQNCLGQALLVDSSLIQLPLRLLTDLTKSVDLLHRGRGLHGHHVLLHHHDRRDHGSEDPHFWFDPLRVAMAAELMMNQLIELDPSNSEAYKTAGEAYISELNELDSTVSALIETVPSENRKLITTHESLGYLEARYGVEVLTTIIPSLSSADEISPAELVDVLDVIEDNDIKVIFVESEAPSVYAETIAAEANIKTVTGLWVETLRENQSYGDWLIENVELIVENLVDLP